jgi:hypothetical protein
MKTWDAQTAQFLNSLRAMEDGLFRSTIDGPPTLYGTCYAMFGLFYLGQQVPVDDRMRSRLANCQDPNTGWLIGPEFNGFTTPTNVMHSREFLELHSTSAALPFFTEFGLPLPYPMTAAKRFCDPSYLADWIRTVDWRRAWFEGNRVMFVGQFLVYLRDVEKFAPAKRALEQWFDWLDRSVDLRTGLWGTNGFCDAKEAVYGGYHQLLVYYHESHSLPNLRGMVDTVLSLQHRDGGFNPHGNAGACEDVDSVDILVNSYKRCDYRRADIRLALRRCLKHILGTQNDDGGFPYARGITQSHMGIPGTQANPNASCTFPTWFRIHTLALIAEVLRGEPALSSVPFRFNSTLSMGWHSSPLGWSPPPPDAVGDARARVKCLAATAATVPRRIYRKCRRIGGKTLQRIGLVS